MKHVLLNFILLLTGIQVSATVTLSLSDCERMALENNKNIKAAHSNIRSSEFTVRSAKGYFFPNIYAAGFGLYSTINGGYNSEGGNLPVISMTGDAMAPTGEFAYFPGFNLDYKAGFIYNAGIKIDQPIYMGGKIRTSYEMAKIGMDVSVLSESLAETDVIYNTNKAYAQLINATQALDVANKYQDVLIAVEQNIRSAVKNGLRTPNDILKVQVRVNEAEMMIKRAENSISLARMNLCHMMGIDLLSDIAISDSIEMPLRTDTLNKDITQRAEYLLLEKQIKHSEQKIKLSKSELLPQVSLRLSYGYLNGIELNDRKLMHNGNFNAMLNINIPITTFGVNSNKVKSEQATLERLRLDREYKNEEMLLELTRSINILDESFIELDIADRSLTQAKVNMTSSESQFKNGMETLSDFLESQALWQEAYSTKVNCSYKLYMAYIDYLKASGQLLNRWTTENE